MEQNAIVAWIERLWPQIENAVTGMVQPWRLYQLGILLACFVVAHLIAKRLRPRMNAWMRGLQGATKARLRMLLVIELRMRLIFFVVISWLSVLVLRASTWPSRSYLVALGAEIASAWLFVAVMTRLIGNPFLRQIVRWSAWIFVTLHLLGLLAEANEVLDSVAFTFGDVRLSMLVVLKAALTLGILLFVAGLIVRLIIGRIDAVEDMSPTMKVLADKLIRIAVYTIAVVLGLQSVGFDMTNLALFSGAIGLGIGFGLQKVVSNLVSGVILLLDKSIKPGDVISLGDTFGWIQTLGARYVSVLTRDGREYLIPNEDLITNQVVNWSHSSDWVRLDIHFGVSYDADPHFVRKIAVEAAQTVERVDKTRAAVCHVTGFGDSSVDFILRFWIHDPSGGLTNVRGAVFLALWDTLKEHDIEIPFPKRDVTLLNPPRAAGD